MSQSTQREAGVTVFGSSLLRVAADLALVQLSVTRQQKRPDAAFKDAREGALALRNFLARVPVEDVQSSRITLSQVWKYAEGGRRSDGYTAKVTFHVLVRDLERLEEVISGAVAAGANELDSVTFQTARLKELRAEARRRAVRAAREKAELYAEAAGAGLGPVVQIEDVKPDQLRGNEGDVAREPQADDEGPPGAFDPGSITVGAAVRITYALEPATS